MKDKKQKSAVKKTASGKVEKKDEFRINKKSGHPTYVYARVGSKFEFIGLTHSEITQGVKNIKLEKNPDPKDKRTAYMRPSAKSDKTKNFKEKKKGWKLSTADKNKAEKIINKKRTSTARAKKR